MFREGSDLVRQAANLRRSLVEGSIRGISGYGTAVCGRKADLRQVVLGPAFKQPLVRPITSTE